MNRVYLLEKTIEYLNILVELQKKFDVRNPHHLTDIIFALKEIKEDYEIFRREKEVKDGRE